MSLHTYIPQDRLRALGHAETLPDRTTGSALFADISGFTALTESLRESLGTRQGAEALSMRLSAVYSALIAEVEQFGGSVIGFAGDAMMCWFGSEDRGLGSGATAVGCGFGMQRAIQSFPELGLKVAVTSGDALRFVVGDPEIQKLDVLAGATVARGSTGEHQANKGDVVLDEATANALGAAVVVKDWRRDEESGVKFAVVNLGTGIRGQGSPTPIPKPLSPDVLQSWVHDTVYERETSGQSAFLTEFRPVCGVVYSFHRH